MSATEWLCIILIIAIVVISWVWAVKDDDFTSYKPMVAYLLSIIGFGIIGSILCTNGIIVLNN